MLHDVYEMIPPLIQEAVDNKKTSKNGEYICLVNGISNPAVSVHFALFKEEKLVCQFFVNYMNKTFQMHDYMTAEYLAVAMVLSLYYGLEELYFYD